MDKVLMKGNDVLAEAAIRSGCRYFFGYPITPQNEVPEYFAKHLPGVGGVFLQAESEIAAIYMVLGAAATGARVMTSSSSPGISLKQEGLSYLAAMELPCVIANVMRGGPGLGGIQAAQGDYFQAVKGGGHGDYKLIVLAPASVQEMADLTVMAFELADRYLNPVLILADGILGQMMESLQLPECIEDDGEKTWAVTGCGDRPAHLITSLRLEPQELMDHNTKLQKKYDQIRKTEQRAESYLTDDAELVIIAFGTLARVAQQVVDECRTMGVKVGLFRPITLWPFPVNSLTRATQRAEKVLVAELNAGQMIEDVILGLDCRLPVDFIGSTGGIILTTTEITGKVKEMIAK